MEMGQRGLRNEKEALVQKKSWRRSLGAGGNSKTLVQSAG